MRVAIVGSRDYPDLSTVRTYINTLLRPDDVVISGGARGVDSAAVQYAQERGLAVEVYPADWDRHGKTAGFIRNQTIVDNADYVVAFWDGRSRGTMDTVNKAQAKGLPYEVVMPAHYEGGAS